VLVLIEGLDLSGKSSVSQCLKSELLSSGYTVQHSYGALHKNKFASYVHDDLCHRETEGQWYIFSTNLYLTLLPVIDRIIYEAPSWDTIVLHESYFCRTIAYNRAHRIPVYHSILNFLQPHLIQFDITLYFTANVETRRKRLESRHAVNSDDRISITKPEFVMTMDNYLAKALSRSTNVIRIDNSALSLNETVELAKKAVIKHLKRG
jgi:thymidylate kinase